MSVLHAFVHAWFPEDHERRERDIYRRVAYAMRYSNGGVTAVDALGMPFRMLTNINESLEQLMQDEADLAEREAQKARGRRR
jgi:hypothetical protein